MLISLLFRRNIAKLSDEQLLEMVRQENHAAIGELFQRYSFLVNGLCLKYTGQREQAEDLTMELFEKLADKIKRSEIQNFKNWLYSVARNECLMYLRKNKLLTSDIETALMRTPDEGEHEIQIHQLLESQLDLLTQCIDELKEEQQKCIKLFYLEQMCYTEVAHLTGYDLKKVKSYIQNGKRNLKLLLEGKDEFNTSR